MHSTALVQGFLTPQAAAIPETSITDAMAPLQMDNWAFAAPVNSTFMQHWLNEYEGALVNGSWRYLYEHARILAMNPEHYPYNDYFLQAACWYVTRVRDFRNASMRLLPSLDPTGPFAVYLMCAEERRGWRPHQKEGLQEGDGACMMRKLFYGLNHSAFNEIAFVKIAHEERYKLEPFAVSASKGSWLGAELDAAVERRVGNSTYVWPPFDDAAQQSSWEQAAATAWWTLSILTAVIIVGVICRWGWLLRRPVGKGRSESSPLMPEAKGATANGDPGPQAAAHRGGS